MNKIMTPGENIMRLGGSELIVSRLGIGAMTWGDISMSPFRKKDLSRLAQIVTLLQEIGNRYGKSASQVALRWLIQKGNVLRLPGVKNSEQANENAGALSFVLTSHEEDALNLAAMQW